MKHFDDMIQELQEAFDARDSQHFGVLMNNLRLWDYEAGEATARKLKGKLALAEEELANLEEEIDNLKSLVRKRISRAS